MEGASNERLAGAVVDFFCAKVNLRIVYSIRAELCLCVWISVGRSNFLY